jgi:hypothetical protein
MKNILQRKKDRERERERERRPTPNYLEMRRGDEKERETGLSVISIKWF